MEFILIAIIYTATALADGSAHTQVLSQQFGNKTSCEKAMNDIQLWASTSLKKSNKNGQLDIFINCYPKN